MAWVKLDDEFTDYPSIIGLSNDAFRLYVQSIGYCSKFYPDTRIPREFVFRSARWTGGRWWHCVKELIEGGLWQSQNGDADIIQDAWILLPQNFYSFAFDRNHEYLLHRNKVFSRDDYACVACGAVEDLTIDHIMPVSKGGSNDLWNLQTLCRSCNSKKGARLE